MGFVERVNPSLLKYEHIPQKIAVLERVALRFRFPGSKSKENKGGGGEKLNRAVTDQPVNFPQNAPFSSSSSTVSPSNFLDSRGVYDVGNDLSLWGLDRVILLEPTRYFKSEVVSRLFSAWFAYSFPSKWVGMTSYGSELAWELNGASRDYYRSVVGDEGMRSKSVKKWETGEGGGVWADGTGGTMIGRGYHVGIIDDPIKPHEAHSVTYQRRFEQWYPSTFVSRAEPGACRVVVMQRLGVRDPIDFLFRREIGDGCEASPEGWHIVCFDEIKSSEALWRGKGVMGLPETCTLEADIRSDGQILAPSRYSEKEVMVQQKASGTQVAKAQRQQRPSSLSGDFWRGEWFGVYEELPSRAFGGGYDWDTAYTKQEFNSASAYIRSYRGPGRRDEFLIYIEDVDWDWCETPELVQWMSGLRGPHYVEAKATGKSVAQFLRRERCIVSEVKVTGGDKMARSGGVQPIVSSGRVMVNVRVFDKLLKGYHADSKRSGRQGLLGIIAESLVSGSGDLDVNDAFVQALNRHSGPSKFGPRMI